MQHLTAALRATASQAATATGGCALLFAAVPGDESADANTRLRAAAGFTSPDEARQASQAMLSAIREVVSSCQPQSLPSAEALGSRGSGAVRILPLGFESRIHGALLAAGPAALDDAIEATLAELASSAAVHLDHASALAQLDQRPVEPPVELQPAEDKSDELLKLSEELFAQDIQLLRSQEKLGKIEKLKNDFIEKMSLELRTPMNSIIEATISVLAGENDSLSDTAKASLRDALDEGTAFQRTLQNILDLWRIKQSELPVELQEVSFAEVVEEAIFSVQETLDAKSLQLEREIEQPLPKITTDLAKINQIVFLLLENAVKFTEEGEIRISAHVEKDVLHCSIADTGIGICTDDQEFIFDEFFQVDEFSSHRYRGAGLGLTLVRDLLILLDGECAVDSEPGRGTAVTFSVPVAMA
jgi:signal transduction histidine kinase